MSFWIRIWSYLTGKLEELEGKSKGGDPSSGDGSTSSYQTKNKVLLFVTSATKMLLYIDIQPKYMTFTTYRPATRHCQQKMICFSLSR